MIGPIKRIVPEIDVTAFRNDTNILELSDDDAMSLMNECKESQLEKLKGSKNACKGAILAQYVTEIPTAFNDLIDMLSGRHDNGH